MGFSSSDEERRLATIANGTSVSTVCDTGLLPVTGIELPIMTSATLTFQKLAHDGSTLLPVYKEDGSLYTITIPSGVASYISLDPSIMCGIRNVVVKTSGNEGAARSIYLCMGAL